MRMSSGIFPSFFLSGFECSTFLWRDNRRLNLVEATQHHTQAHQDYQRLRELGIAVAREAIPWPLVDRAGRCDFTRLDPILDALNAARVLPIWDLCHYGYPDDLDPFAPAFTERFALYCQAAAEYVRPRLPGPHFFTPINEISYFAVCAGEWGWAAPCGTTRQQRFDLRLALCRAAVAAVRAIRAVIPDARMVHPDPLVNVVAPRDRPDQADAALDECSVDPFVAWDILAGQALPELGGAPDVLDIVGANHYAVGQMEYREHGPHQALPPGDDRIVPLRTLLQRLWERYRRPILIAETSGHGADRPAWLRYVMEESLAALAGGANLHGICLFPAVSSLDWHTGAIVPNGLYDLVEADGELRRVPNLPYLQELGRWQRELDHAVRKDGAASRKPVTPPAGLGASGWLTKRPGVTSRQA